jgi:MFS family permease
MKTGIFFLVLGYVLSQFYRAFLAVLAPMLSADIGVRADELALASGLWFLAFAAMQLPVGWALDRLGPRRTAAWLLGSPGAAARWSSPRHKGHGRYTWRWSCLVWAARRS